MQVDEPFNLSAVTEALSFDKTDTVFKSISVVAHTQNEQFSFNLLRDS